MTSKEAEVGRYIQKLIFALQTDMSGYKYYLSWSSKYEGFLK